MPDPRPDLESPHESRYGDVRADYDDEFEVRRTPDERVVQLVLGPAVGFVVLGLLGIIGLAFAAFALLANNLGRALDGWPSNQTYLLAGMFFVVVGLVLFGLVIAAGVNMRHLRRRRLALFAAYTLTGLFILGPLSIPFTPFGIWGLVVLYRPDVRRAFDRGERTDGRDQPG